jgi:hypothetical protein
MPGWSWDVRARVISENLVRQFVNTFDQRKVYGYSWTILTKVGRLAALQTAPRSAPATAPASWPAYLAITVLRLTGQTSIAAALRYHARRPGRPLQTIMNC